MDPDCSNAQEYAPLMPTRFNLPHKVIDIYPPNCTSKIDTKNKTIVTPMIADKKNKAKNYEIFDVVLPMLLFNKYKFLVLRDIAKTLDKLGPNCPLTSDYYVKFVYELNPVNTGKDYVRFIRHFRKTIDILFFYLIMDNFPCNYILYNQHKAIIYNSISNNNKQVFLFNFITSDDIEYMGYHTSIEDWTSPTKMPLF